MPTPDSYLVTPQSSSPGAQDNFPSVPRGVWRKSQSRAGHGFRARDWICSSEAWPGPAGPTQEGPLLTDGLCPCHQLHVTAKHHWLLQAGRPGSQSQSAHTKSLCRTAGCQHGQVPSPACQVSTRHGAMAAGPGRSWRESQPLYRSPSRACCWLPSLLGSARRHSKVRTGTRDQGRATKYRQKTCSLCSCIATGLAGAGGGNSRNGSTEAEGTLTEIVSEGNRKERRTSWSRTPVHRPQMAVRDMVASTMILCMDCSRSSLGRHSGRVTSAAGIGSNNHYNALSPSSKTRQVSRAAVMKRASCSGMQRRAAGSQPHICQQQYSERQEHASGP